jgi:hypothetical protein
MWNWFRKKVCDTFLAGCADAVEALEREDGPAVVVALPAGLAARLRALPAPAPEAEPEPEPETNGRKKSRA